MNMNLFHTVCPVRNFLSQSGFSDEVFARIFHLSKVILFLVSSEITFHEECKSEFPTPPQNLQFLPPFSVLIYFRRQQNHFSRNPSNLCQISALQLCLWSLLSPAKWHFRNCWMRTEISRGATAFLVTHLQFLVLDITMCRSRRLSFLRLGLKPLDY
jgi:hypothetical protein